MVDRWYPLTIKQTQVDGGFTIVLTTDVACHLYLYWTDNPPWVHLSTRLDRGLRVPWDAYWCFVNWTQIEQSEPWDTYTHTFTWLDWLHCQTKYFRFAGTVAGNTSPSDSPIFQKHYAEPFVIDRWAVPTGGQVIYLERWRGNQFIPPVSGYIRLLRQRLGHRVGSPGQMVLSIYDTQPGAVGYPKNAIISQIFDGDAITDLPFQTYEFTFDSMKLLYAGKKYAYIFKGWGDINNRILLAGHTGQDNNDYPIVSLDQGTTWDIYDGVHRFPYYIKGIPH